MNEEDIAVIIAATDWPRLKKSFGFTIANVIYQ